MLRGVVALEAHRPWLRRVWYLDPQLKYTEGPLSSELRSEQEAFVAQLACALMHCSFVSEERVPVGSLYILRRGLCSRGWNFLGPGRVWGEDLIVNYPQLIDTTPTVALTYVEVLRLAHPPPSPPSSPLPHSPPPPSPTRHPHRRLHDHHHRTAGAATGPCRHVCRGDAASRRGRAHQACCGALAL